MKMDAAIKPLVKLNKNVWAQRVELCDTWGTVSFFWRGGILKCLFSMGNIHRDIFVSSRYESVISSFKILILNIFLFLDSGSLLAWTFLSSNRLLMNKTYIIHWLVPHSPSRKLQSAWRKRYSSKGETCHPFKSNCYSQRALHGSKLLRGGCDGPNLMLHYANWSSQLTIILVMGQTDWVCGEGAQAKVF